MWNVFSLDFILNLISTNKLLFQENGVQSLDQGVFF